jgi:hypothetical protein
MKNAAARFGLLLAASSAGCEPPRHDGVDCSKKKCHVLSERPAREFPDVIKGGSIEIRDFRPFCRLDVSWSVFSGPTPHFHAMLDALEGELLPMPGGFVKIHACRGLAMPAPTSRPYAVLVLDPDSADLPPLQADDVFIPMDGDAALDETFFASARVDPAPDGGPVSVSIVSRSRSSRGDEGIYPSLREGDSFVWGPSTARIVHIVPLRAHNNQPAGWVEVQLSPKSAAAQN